MGWFSDVADILDQRGYFQLVTHDGTRFREVDELEAERDALRTALVDSTELLRVALCMTDGEAYGFVEQIYKNEAVLTKGGR